MTEAKEKWWVVQVLANSRLKRDDKDTHNPISQTKSAPELQEKYQQEGRGLEKRKGEGERM